MLLAAASNAKPVNITAEFPYFHAYVSKGLNGRLIPNFLVSVLQDVAPMHACAGFGLRRVAEHHRASRICNPSSVGERYNGQHGPPERNFATSLS